MRVVVVDNDSQASARTTCETWRQASGWALEYVIEMRRGIPFARNTAFDHAGSADWVAFLDDDEEASTEWLDQLLAVQSRYDADVVTGPVVPQFEKRVPSWVIDGRFFERPRHETGEQLPVAFSGNVLIRSAILDGNKLARNVSAGRPFSQNACRESGFGTVSRKMAQNLLGRRRFSEKRRIEPGFGTASKFRFDERLRYSGGSDSLFFRRLASCGYRIVWADTAVVAETIPASKATAKWLVLRSFRTGATLSFIDVDGGRTLSTYPLTAAKGVTWMAIGAGSCLAGLLLGHAARVRGVRWTAFGMGRLAGLVGRRYDEYRTTHGT